MKLAWWRAQAEIGGKLVKQDGINYVKVYREENKVNMRKDLVNEASVHQLEGNTHGILESVTNVKILGM